MNELIETIRAGVTEGATPAQKSTAAQACRTLLTALEAEVGKQMAPPGVPAPHPIANVDPGQALDLLIAKLRAAVPAGDAAGNTPKPEAVRFAFVKPSAPSPKRG